MNSRHRTAITAVVVLAAGIAGWCSVREPVAAKPSAVIYAPPARPPEPPPQDSSKSAAIRPAALASLEKELIRILDPGAGEFTGERLMELCLEKHTSDLQPPAAAACAYARAWAAKNPAEMLAWFLRRGSFALTANIDPGFSFLHAGFRGWANQDAAAAVAGALSIPGNGDRAAALATIIQTLRKSDPARAASLAAQHLSFLASQGVPVLLSSGQEIKDEWNFLRALPDGQDRTNVLTGFLRQVLKHNRQELPGLWKEMPENLRREVVARGFPDAAPGTSVLDGLADLQREHVEATHDPQATRTWLDTGAREWAGRDPTAAFAWMQQHLKGEQRVEATAQLFASAAAGSFESAAQLWHSLPDGILRACAAGNLAAGAPGERKAEVDALLATLSPADRSIADATRQSAANALRRRQSLGNLSNHIWNIQQQRSREDE